MEEEWKSLNGCNMCINTSICKCYGNCILLTVDQEFPNNTKDKRRVIQRLRTMPNYDRGDKIRQIVDEIVDPTSKWPEPEITPKAWAHDEDGKYRQTQSIDRTGYKVKSTEKTYRTWNGKVTLTQIERMFIDQIKKYQNETTNSTSSYSNDDE